MVRFGTGLIAALLVAGSFGLQAHADNASRAIKAFDPDHDGTLDVSEVKQAAAAQFAKLDTDHDGTLDMKELGHRVTKAEFRKADKDHDGTLDKDEYASIVVARFHAANRDKDDTLDAHELRTAAGRRLLKLMQ